MNGDKANKGVKLAKAALAKSNTVSVQVLGDYENDRKKFNSLEAHLGVNYSGTTVINSNIDTNTSVNTAHRTSTGNPHGTTAADVGAAADTHNHDMDYAVLTHNHTEADVTDLDKYTQSEVDTLLLGKEDSITGYTGTITVVTGVDFVGESTTTQDITVENGVITGVV